MPGEALESRINAMVTSPLLPFEGEFRLKTLSPLMAHELVRDGEGDRPCHRCAVDDGDVKIPEWTNGRSSIYKKEWRHKR